MDRGSSIEPGCSYQILIKIKMNHIVTSVDAHMGLNTIKIHMRNEHQ